MIVVLLGLGALVIEAQVSAAGVLGALGVTGVAAGVGAILAGSGIALLITIPIAVVLAGVGLVTMALVAGEVVLARRQPLRSGPEALVGQRAMIHRWNAEDGLVAADGTLWRARLAFGWDDPPPTVGQTVVIHGLDGLTLSVRRPTPWEVQPVWKPSSLSL